MKVRLLVHSSFLITAENGTKLITDPYTVNERMKYAPISESADIVTVSHEHGDHNNTASVKGNPQVLRGAVNTTIKGIEIRGILAFHDATEGKQRGPNTIFCMTVDGVRVCHMGDLGHQLSDKQVAEIGKVDIIMTPMGGNYTIDAVTATELVNKLKPGVTIPMHFRNPKCDYPVTEVFELTRDKKNAKDSDSSEIEVKKGAVPKNQIIVLKPAL